MLSLNFCLGLKNELTFTSNAIAMLCIMCESAKYMVLLYVYYLVNKFVPSRYIFSKTPGPKSEIIFNGLKTEKVSKPKPKVTIYLWRASRIGRKTHMMYALSLAEIKANSSIFLYKTRNRYDILFITLPYYFLVTNFLRKIFKTKWNKTTYCLQLNNL